MATYTAAAVGGNWNVSATWGGAGVPTTGDTVLFNELSGPVTVTLGAACSELNLNSGTGYANIITFANTLSISANATLGNITFSSKTALQGFAMVGPNGIAWSGIGNLSKTITNFTVPFNLPFTTSGSSGNTFTLSGNFTVSNLSSNSVGTFNGSNLIINGNVSAIISAGTSSCVLAGASTIWNTGTTLNRVVFDSSGTITISGTVSCLTSITWTSGTLVSTGSTVSMQSMSAISLAGRTLNNMSFPTTATVCTVTGDFTLTGNLSFGGAGATMNGAGRVFVSGNVSGSGNSGSFRIEMNGTSNTISGTVNQSVIINTSGTITVGAGCDIGGNSNLTLTAGTLNLSNNLTRRGGTTTIAIGFLFTGSGNLLFRDTPFAATAHTVISNGVSFPNSVQILPATNVSNSLTLNDNFTVLGSFSCLVGGSGNQAQTINGNSLFVRGDFIVTTTGGVIGTTNIILEGSANANWTMSGPIQNNFTVNKSGVAVVTAANSITWGLNGRTLTLNSIVNFATNTTFTLSAAATSTLTISNSSSSQFFNMVVPVSITLILSGGITRITNNLTLNGATTFSGTFGWDCNNLICSTAGPYSITLLEGVTYRTRTGVSITGGTAANRVTMQSSSGSIRAIWTLNFGATQSMIYVNGTRIDSSGEQTVWSFGVSAANISTTINWNPGLPLRTVAYTFVN